MMKFALALTSTAVYATKLGSLDDDNIQVIPILTTDDAWLQRDDIDNEWWWNTDFDEVYDLGEDFWPESLAQIVDVSNLSISDDWGLDDPWNHDDGGIEIYGLDEQDLQEWGNFSDPDPWDLDDGGVEIEGLEDEDL